jgi:hypothetical protein
MSPWLRPYGHTEKAPRFVAAELQLAGASHAVSLDVLPQVVREAPLTHAPAPEGPGFFEDVHRHVDARFIAL